MADEVSTWDAAQVVARAKATIHSSNVRLSFFSAISSVPRAFLCVSVGTADAHRVHSQLTSSLK